MQFGVDAFSIIISSAGIWLYQNTKIAGNNRAYRKWYWIL